jgi:hypothetical protein
MGLVVFLETRMLIRKIVSQQKNDFPRSPWGGALLLVYLLIWLRLAAYLYANWFTLDPVLTYGLAFAEALFVPDTGMMKMIFFKNGPRE